MWPRSGAAWICYRNQNLGAAVETGESRFVAPERSDFLVAPHSVTVRTNLALTGEAFPGRRAADRLS